MNIFSKSIFLLNSDRIADVLKATMAAPTYFPPQHLHKQIIKDGRFVKDPNSDHIPPEIFIDGGVFANDPDYLHQHGVVIQDGYGLMDWQLIY
jgi:patatin-like phospholipase/acyl hydrolase